MAVSMIPCPACRAMLFSDTIVCPACRHVLDESQAAQINQSEDSSTSRSEQIPCRKCGEANQIGLVRCWNCKSFLREDIQEAYYQMLRTQREITYSQPGNQSDDGPLTDPGDSSSMPEVDDDDFELDEGYSLSPAPTQNNPPTPDTSETYGLNTSAPTNAPANGSAGETPAAETPAAETPKTEAPEHNSPDRETPARTRPESEEESEDHSVATGGDVLLDIALQEEQEAEKLRQKRQAQAQRKKQRSKKGSSSEHPPSPERLAAQKKALARRKAAQKRAAEKKRLAELKAKEKYGLWLTDIRQHAANPKKIKHKPGSAEKQFSLVDVGCSAEGVIVVTLTKKPGITLFSKPKSSPEETRQATKDHLEAGKPLEELPAASHQFFAAETVETIQVVQPVVYVHESLFAGVPVFGEGRIVVQLPNQSEGPEEHFLSFSLTEFRQFSAAFEQRFQIKDLGILQGVPLTDPWLDLSCHYSEDAIHALDPAATSFYQADPKLELKLVGRRCESCELAVSEDARRKEKIGGLNGKIHRPQ